MPAKKKMKLKPYENRLNNLNLGRKVVCRNGLAYPTAATATACRHRHRRQFIQSYSAINDEWTPKSAPNHAKWGNLFETFAPHAACSRQKVFHLFVQRLLNTSANSYEFRSKLAQLKWIHKLWGISIASSHVRAYSVEEMNLSYSLDVGRGSSCAFTRTFECISIPFRFNATPYSVHCMQGCR